MIMTDHDYFERQGLLSGALDEATRATWPSWARAHVVSCATCAAMLQADTALRRAVSERSPHRPTPPAPTLASLALRLQNAPVPSLDTMASEHALFPAARFRDRALTLTRSPKGVSAWDPEAGQVAIYAIDPTGEVNLVTTRESSSGGVALDVSLDPPGGARVVAVSVGDVLDVEVWRLWLRDLVRDDPLRPLPSAEGHDRVHLAELRIRPVLPQRRIRILEGELPPMSPAVDAAVAAAMAAGRRGESAAAGSAYQAVIGLASDAGDITGVIRGKIGVGTALFTLGFFDDASTVLLDVIEQHALDRHRASQVCRAMAWLTFLGGDFTAVDAWISEAKLVEPDGNWVAFNELFLAFVRGDSATLARVGAEGTADPNPQAGYLRRLLPAIAAAHWSGMADPPLPGGCPPDPALEVSLWHLVGEQYLTGNLAAERASGADRLVQKLATFSARPLTGMEALPVVWLATKLAANPRAASELLRARFLADVSGQETGGLLAAATIGPTAVLTSGPSEVRVLGCEPLAFREAVLALHERIIFEQPGDGPLLTLRSLLGGLPASPFCTASDGLLDGIPWPLMGTSATLLHVTEALGRRGRSKQVPVGRGIRSLVDPFDDLPLARVECPQGAHVDVFTGADAFAARLATDPTVGILHLATHVYREDGVPMLRLADGPVSVSDLVQLRLDGGPYVFLAACCSAVRPSRSGTERSLADGFLRAGASAVVATRWPLRDQEAFELFRPLLAAWPFSDLEHAVANVSQRLRENGRPMRVWGALAVYRG